MPNVVTPFPQWMAEKIWQGANEETKSIMRKDLKDPQILNSHAKSLADQGLIYRGVQRYVVETRSSLTDDYVQSAREALQWMRDNLAK